MKTHFSYLVSVALAALISCTANDPFSTDDFPGGGNFPGMGGAPGMSGIDDSDAPDFNTEIYPYQNQTATDADKDVIGTDNDIYWELNTFKNKVNITYSGETATVETDNQAILVNTDGAHVVIDMLSNSVSGVEINISGKSDNGSLKIYGDKKTLLNINGVELTSTIGPAINNQCKKRLFVNLKSGSVNKLTDSSSYSDDPYYIPGNNSAGEDRKGCFFSEGNLIFSGNGSLIVAGRQKHAIASDGYMYVRPGVTIAVTEAVKNAIHIKGDKTDNTGIIIDGGLIYTLTESEAGKGLKTDYNIEIRGGDIELNTTGNAIFDADENDTSSASGMKADGDINISGGNISLKSIGIGGKGINADGDISFNGGNTTIVTTGTKYTYNRNFTSSPKGIKADGNITVDNGTINVMVTGISDGSEGMESKSDLTINGGEIFIYAYDDAINAGKSITVNGGRVYSYSLNNDGIDSNGTLVVNGGLILSNGANAPEEPFDCDRSENFKVNGGILIGIGGTSVSPSSSSLQRTVIYNGLQISKGRNLALLDASGKPMMTFTLPRSLNGTLFFSSPTLQSGAVYELSSGGNITGATDNWNGWYDEGTWSNGTKIGSFTVSGMVTSIGQSNAPGANPPGR